jgi:hypothetical protein
MTPTLQTERGLMDTRPYYNKFLVVRRETGEEVTEPTFTLIPSHDKHAKVALLAYADACEDDNPALANDLRTLVVAS